MKTHELNIKTHELNSWVRGFWFCSVSQYPSVSKPGHFCCIFPGIRYVCMSYLSTYHELNESSKPTNSTRHPHIFVAYFQVSGMCVWVIYLPITNWTSHQKPRTQRDITVNPESQQPNLQQCPSVLKSLAFKVEGGWVKSLILMDPPPPPGVVSYLLCSLIKNREKEDPPWTTAPKIFSSGGVLFLLVLD